jgi:RimJ/RimL family protein N-acetyltransferase
MNSGIAPTNAVIVRKALPADLDTLLRFEQGVIATERPFDSTLKTGKIHYYDLMGMINAPDVELLVAELDGALIGSGYARLEAAKHYLKHPIHAYLGFMWVEPEHRGMGVNQQIIDALTAWARSRNSNELRLDVYHENERAIKAYEKAGFSKNMINMRKGI